jgi:hypothetical protein
MEIRLLSRDNDAKNHLHPVATVIFIITWHAMLNAKCSNSEEEIMLIIRVERVQHLRRPTYQSNKLNWYKNLHYKMWKNVHSVMHWFGLKKKHVEMDKEGNRQTFAALMVSLHTSLYGPNYLHI